MGGKTIPLYLFTGFLGSGKTSVINSLLEQMRDKKVGLVLNDFGAITVDSALVKGSGEVVASTSLSGGQIFCSCLSGSFINAVEAMVDLQPDSIIVEASGLAKPAPLLEIVSVIQQRTKGAVTYGGMICVIDAERYLLLSQVLKTLEEQIMFSDWFILNKTDLVDGPALQEIETAIGALRPLAPLFKTSYGTVSAEMVSQLEAPGTAVPITIADAARYQGWGTHGRPKNCVFLPSMPFTVSTLQTFLTKVSSQMLRMKGFIPTSEGKALMVDVVGPHVRVNECDMPSGIEPGVMCIHSADVDAVTLLQGEWKRIADSPSSCIPTP